MHSSLVAGDGLGARLLSANTLGAELLVGRSLGAGLCWVLGLLFHQISGKLFMLLFDCRHDGLGTVVIRLFGRVGHYLGSFSCK